MWTNFSDYYTLDPFPDELFLSTVARTVSLVGLGHFSETMLHYFGRHRREPTAVIPVGKFPDPVSVYYQSVAPYYISAQPLKRQETLLKRMFSSDEKSFTGCFKTGRNSSFLKKPKLSYCPLCLLEDLEKFGMPYFHLSQQYGGIQACAKHGVRLIEFHSSGKFTQLPVLTPEDYQEPVPANPRDITYSQWSQEFKNLSHEYLNIIYQKKALDTDIALFNKKKLYSKLERYFGRGYLSMVGCSEDQLNVGNYKILFLINYISRTVHPFYHFMLWEFLGLKPTDFKEPVFALNPKPKFFPVPNPGNLSSLSVKKQGLGCTVYEINDPISDLFQFYPTDIKEYTKNLQ